MTYGELVKFFWRKSGVAINEYAERVGYSTPQVSMVLNGHQAGTLKMIQACVRDAEMDMQDLLWVPESAEAADERKVLRAFKSLDADGRQQAQDLLDSLAELQALKEKQRSKRG